MSKERGIIMSGESVPRILDGSKVETRRVVRPGPGQRAWLTDEVIRWVRAFGPPVDGWCTMATEGGHIGSVRCPYGVPGDRLYVKESWRPVSWTDDGDEVLIAYPAGPTSGSAQAEAWCKVTGVEQFAHEDWLAREEARIEAAPMLCAPNRPSIFMPRWASRLVLEVVSVRVERVQEITDDGARAEGVVDVSHLHGAPSCRATFTNMWNAINGKRAPWESNPWVWVVRFKKYEREHPLVAPENDVRDTVKATFAGSVFSNVGEPKKGGS